MIHRFINSSHLIILLIKKNGDEIMKYNIEARFDEDFASYYTYITDEDGSEVFDGNGMYVFETEEEAIYEGKIFLEEMMK